MVEPATETLPAAVDVQHAGAGAALGAKAAAAAADIEVSGALQDRGAAGAAAVNRYRAGNAVSLADGNSVALRETAVGDKQRCIAGGTCAADVKDVAASPLRVGPVDAGRARGGGATRGDDAIDIGDGACARKPTGCLRRPARR